PVISVRLSGVSSTIRIDCFSVKSSASAIAKLLQSTSRKRITPCTAGPGTGGTIRPGRRPQPAEGGHEIVLVDRLPDLRERVGPQRAVQKSRMLRQVIGGLPVRVREVGFEFFQHGAGVL